MSFKPLALPLTQPTAFFATALILAMIFFAMTLILAPIFDAGPRSFLNSQCETKSTNRMAAAANISAKEGPASPFLTALRKATNLPSAAMIRCTEPQAACIPWTMSITAPAAGTIMAAGFSIRMEIRANGMAD